jgi:hypothetical protein
MTDMQLDQTKDGGLRRALHHMTDAEAEASRIGKQRVRIIK